MSFIGFFLNTKASVRQLQLLEISHPNFSQVYRIVRNARLGVTVTLEDSSSHFFQYYPLQISGLGVNETLDQVLQIQLGDLGELLPTELDNVAAAGGFAIKPTVKYRAYRSDDLTQPMVGPLILEITNMTLSETGSAFEAAAPTANANATGEYYTLDRFPMLRGML